MNTYIIPFERLGMGDVELVGGKNASIGEMIGNLARLGVQVPTGFATTSQAFRDFLAQNGLGDRITALLKDLNVDDVDRLVATGAEIRRLMLETPFPPRLEQEVLAASPCAPRRPRRTCPRPRSPASRKRSSTCAVALR